MPVTPCELDNQVTVLFFFFFDGHHGVYRVTVHDVVQGQEP